MSRPSCCRPMAAGSSPVGRRSPVQRDHRRRKLRRLPHSPRHAIVQVAAAETAPPPAAPQEAPPQATSAGPGPARAAGRGTAGSRSASRRSASGSSPVAAKDRARSRDAGAEHRTAQGEPAADGRRKFKGHRRAQGQPGRDEAHDREGFRTTSARRRQRLPRRRLRWCAGPSGPIKRRTHARGLGITRGTSISTTIGSRRVDDRHLRPAITPAARARRIVLDILENARLAQNRAAPALRYAQLFLSSHSTCQFREAGAACSHG